MFVYLSIYLFPFMYRLCIFFFYMDMLIALILVSMCQNKDSFGIKDVFKKRIHLKKPIGITFVHLVLSLRCYVMKVLCISEIFIEYLHIIIV